MRGVLVRPRPRPSQGRTRAATAPDRQETWPLHVGPTALTLHAACWDDVGGADARPGAPTCRPVLMHDPRVAAPRRLNTSLPWTGAQLQAFSRDRWPVAGLPLTAKQMVGAARQFVCAPARRQRRPELALGAGAILM